MDAITEANNVLYEPLEGDEEPESEPEMVENEETNRYRTLCPEPGPSQPQVLQTDVIQFVAGQKGNPKAHFKAFDYAKDKELSVCC